MLRKFSLFLLPLTVLVGCMRPTMPIEPPQKPAAPCELKMLEPMVGTWTGTGEMIEPCPEKMKAMMPEGERDKFQSTFSGGWKTEKTLDGMAFKSEGWYEMGEGMKVNYVEYMTWNAAKKKFQSMYVSDWNESGIGWMTPCPDGQCFCSEAEGIDATGKKKKMTGCMKFVDKDTIDWTFTEHGPYGKMVMKGTSKRK